MAINTLDFGLAGELSPAMAALRRPGLVGNALAGVDLPRMAKAATQSGTRNGGKLTQAQMDARAQ